MHLPAVKKVSGSQQCETEGGARQIEVVTRAIRLTPTHSLLQVKGFADVRQDDHDQTSRADKL